MYKIAMIRQLEIQNGCSLGMNLFDMSLHHNIINQGFATKRTLDHFMFEVKKNVFKYCFLAEISQFSELTQSFYQLSNDQI